MENPLQHSARKVFHSMIIFNLSFSTTICEAQTGRAHSRCTSANVQCISQDQKSDTSSTGRILQDQRHAPRVIRIGVHTTHRGIAVQNKDQTSSSYRLLSSKNNNRPSSMDSSLCSSSRSVGLVCVLTGCYCNRLVRRAPLMLPEHFVGCSSDDASRGRELSPEAHEVGIHVTCCLSSFIDAPSGGQHGIGC